MIRFFADSTFLISLQNQKETDHPEATRMFSYLQKKRDVGLKDLYLSNFIIIEVFHKLHEDMSFEKAQTFFEESIHNNHVFHLTISDVQEAFSEVLIHFNKQISMVDATIVLLKLREKIDYILTFDKGFLNVPLCAAINDMTNLQSIIG
jgi:predicted nucleic acid-binding protein